MRKARRSTLTAIWHMAKEKQSTRLVQNTPTLIKHRHSTDRLGLDGTLNTLVLCDHRDDLKAVNFTSSPRHRTQLQPHRRQVHVLAAHAARMQ